MKKILFFVWALCSAFAGLCQNTFPNPGNVGIGTLNPENGFLLDVNGLGTIGTQNNARIYLGTFDSSNAFIQARNNVTNQSLKFFAASFNFDIGNVGIGTTDTKGYKLAVTGNMIAESVKVQLQGSWSDFVFADDYKLPTLEETAKHIKEKGHLPGIPSAAEVKTNGIDLGEMNAKLLQKIEELTLHLIEQSRRMDVMQKENEMQKEDIEYLKSKNK